MELRQEGCDELLVKESTGNQGGISWLTLIPEFRRLRIAGSVAGRDGSSGQAGLGLHPIFPYKMYGLREESLWQIMFLR
jgi:hypothetical protein